MKTNETTTENQTQQSPEVGCCELLALIKWARSGESTGGPRTRITLNQMADALENQQMVNMRLKIGLSRIAKGNHPSPHEHAKRLLTLIS